MPPESFRLYADLALRRERFAGGFFLRFPVEGLWRNVRRTRRGCECCHRFLRRVADLIDLGASKSMSSSAVAGKS